MNKKFFLIVLVVLLAVILVGGCAPDEEVPVDTPIDTPDEEVIDDRPFEGQTLIVGTWSGPYAESMNTAIFEPFEELTGVNIEYKLAWDHTPEILAAPADDPPMDVAIAAGSDFLLGINQELWLPIRYENVPNAYEVWPNMLEFMGPWTDDGMPVYGVPFDVGIHVLFYRKDLVDTEPTSWMDLWSEEYRDRIMLENYYPYNLYVGAFLSDEMQGAEEIYSPDEGHDALIDALARMVTEQGVMWYGGGAELIAAMEAEEIIVSNYWNGSALLTVLDYPDKYNMVFPEEGSAAYLDYFAVVRGTEKQDLAELFIDFALDIETQNRFAEVHNQVVANKNITIPTSMEGFYPYTTEEWDRVLFLDVEYLEPYRIELDERVTREVLTQ